jgi:hypothetical protein
LNSTGEQTALKPPVKSGEVVPAPGRRSLILAAVLLGALALALQLWLLTTALDLFLAGEGRSVWQLAVVSGVFFAGGLLALFLTGHAVKAR